MLPSVVPRLATDLAVRVFLDVWKFLSFLNSLPGTELCPYIFWRNIMKILYFKAS